MASTQRVERQAVIAALRSAGGDSWAQSGQRVSGGLIRADGWPGSMEVAAAEEQRMGQPAGQGRPS